MRYVCQFSCGAASAVMCKLILAEMSADRVVIANAFIRQEHEDNRRFLDDCEKWFAHPVEKLQDKKYNASTYDVWARKRFMWLYFLRSRDVGEALSGPYLRSVRRW